MLCELGSTGVPLHSRGVAGGLPGGLPQHSRCPLLRDTAGCCSLTPACTWRACLPSPPRLTLASDFFCPQTLAAADAVDSWTRRRQSCNRGFDALKQSFSFSCHQHAHTKPPSRLSCTATNWLLQVPRAQRSGPEHNPQGVGHGGGIRDHTML